MLFENYVAGESLVLPQTLEGIFGQALAAVTPLAERRKSDILFTELMVFGYIVEYHTKEKML